MIKPVVRYVDLAHCVVGECAIVLPLDHKSPLVSNAKWARTSPVLTKTQGEHGPLFETQNTLYRPLPPEDEPATEKYEEKIDA